MNAFPQDENNTSAISELHSILEESSILSANHSILPDDDLRDYFEGIVSLTPWLNRWNQTAGIENSHSSAKSVLSKRRNGND